jgi:hypothetical protein
MLNVTDVPGDQDIVFIAEATKLLIVRKLGEISIHHMQESGHWPVLIQQTLAHRRRAILPNY